ncbi:putative protein kinase [Trypanosoma cruzi]|uniref:Protein kinase domain-containing protein n=1 Tax=Trypanosoma cruzi TaxID=5693 RepID=A0A2V2XCT4_TRYCR|nr:putative protein kinase [Trypanosoma cruzi]
MEEKVSEKTPEAAEVVQMAASKASESRHSAEYSMQNPLGSIFGKSAPIHPMPSFSLYNEGHGLEEPEGEEARNATEDSVETDYEVKKSGFVISTVLAVALVISFGVIAVGLIGFLPGHMIGFRAVSGTAEIIQVEAVRGVIIIMRSTILQLPDFAHTITANYMRNQTSAYTVNAFPKNSQSLLYSLLSVLSTFKDTISFFNFMDRRGLYGFASEILWPNESGSMLLLGAHNSTTGISPVMTYNATILDVVSPDPLAYWNISDELSQEQGRFELIVDPWVKNKSITQRWFPSALNRTGLYFDFIIPFEIDGFAGYCEVGMPTHRLLRESRPLIAALRKHGRVMLFDDKRDIVILTSWGENSTWWAGDSYLSFGYLTLDGIKDPLAAAVARQVKSNRKQMSDVVNGTTELVFPFENSAVRASFARVTDKNGLNVMLSVAVLRSDFFSGIVQARTIIIVVVVAVVTMSAITAFVGACYLVKPLTHLVNALKKASNLELPGSDSKVMKPSRILEVGEIQADYVKLFRQLLMLRKFVPEAILARINLGDMSTLTASVDVNENADDRDSSFSSNTSRSQVVGNEIGVKRDVRLNSDVFREQLNLFSPRHCTVVAVEFHASQLWDDSKKYMTLFIATATELSGCVEVLGPDKIVVSFGAHTTIPLHSIEGCRFAFEFLSKLSPYEQGAVTIVVECNEFLVGTCGAHLRNARVLLGTDYLFDLTRAMSGAPYHIAATSGVASQIQGYQAFPVDCVLIPSTSLPVVLYELRLLTTGEEHTQNVTKLFRLGFSAMRQGNYKQAISHFQRVEKSDPQAQRLIRLCAQRRLAKDTTPYVRCVNNSYDIANNTFQYSSGEIWNEVPEKRELINKTPVSLKRENSNLSREESMALFELCQSSSSSSESFQALEDGCNSADDLPLLLTDMNHRVWTRSLKKISEGAFSAVFLGMSEDGGQVAIKCIPRRRRDIMQESLEAEMNVASKLRHPNIVQYVSCSVVQSHLAIIMEYVPGGSLHAVIKNFGRMSSLVARRFTVDILNGLSYLHGLGIVHCDVKPHNMLLGMDGVCKLSDFGSTISEAADMARTMADEVMLRGTALYMAPEVAAGGRCTSQSDIFSLGISLLEMLLGRLPWKWSSKAPEGSDATSLQALFNRDLLFVQSLARDYLEPEIPDFLDFEVAHFVRSCCHPNPAMRPSASALLSYSFVL